MAGDGYPAMGEPVTRLPEAPSGPAPGERARPITAGEEPQPQLPSELLASSGVGAWVLRPEDLDRLGVLTSAPRTRTPAEDRGTEPASDPLDAYRTPDGQVGPDTHVTLSYRELRRLIALHLSTCASTMPRERGWLYAEDRARAMSEGEAPLRLREVLE